MITEIEYALLAGAAYYDTRTDKGNNTGSGLAFCHRPSMLNHVPPPTHRISWRDLPRHLAR
jgi:hypothetical protein